MRWSWLMGGTFLLFTARALLALCLCSWLMSVLGFLLIRDPFWLVFLVPTMAFWYSFTQLIPLDEYRYKIALYKLEKCCPQCSKTVSEE